MRNFLFQREREREKRTKLVNFVPSNLSLSSKLWIFIIGIFIYRTRQMLRYYFIPV